MLIFRYLAKEVFITLVALTSILLLIFMSNQLVSYLNRAANGQIPGFVVLKLMMFELPTLMSLLLPLGFYMAVLLAYGRLYAESEMTVLQACGYGSMQLLKHTMYMAIALAILVLTMMMWVSPIIAKDRVKLLQNAGLKTLIQTIVPGRFHAFADGEKLFYVESMNRLHTEAKNVFYTQSTFTKTDKQWDILWAERARTVTDKKTHESYVVLEKGRWYRGSPGKADFHVAEFQQYEGRMPHPEMEDSQDMRTVKTSSLFPLKTANNAQRAEFQWRVSIPMMVLTLALVAVPLSRVNPRAGKFSTLLPAIVIFIIYANFLFISRDWLQEGKIPAWIGLWWTHLIVALLGGTLLWRSRA